MQKLFIVFQKEIRAIKSQEYDQLFGLDTNLNLKLVVDTGLWKKIDDLRRKYKNYLWDAEFRDTQGASVSADGSARYFVFVTAEGRRAVVVVNTETEKLLKLIW